MLKNLPVIGIRSLVIIFNELLKGSEIPQSWREVRIVPIPKLGKNADSAEGYRPIALLSCCRKVFEKLVKSRPEWQIESKKLLDPTQYGFRSSRGVQHCQALLLGNIYRTFARREILITVFLYLKAAYDNVNIEVLCRIMRDLGISVNT